MASGSFVVCSQGDVLVTFPVNTHAEETSVRKGNSEWRDSTHQVQVIFAFASNCPFLQPGGCAPCSADQPNLLSRQHDGHGWEIGTAKPAAGVDGAKKKKRAEQSYSRDGT